MQNTTITAQDAFERLTSSWEQETTDPETGATVMQDMPPLLNELREAVFGGMEKTGGSAGFEARMPISSGALDLYETIDMEIAETWACLFPGQIPNADRTERLLSQIVAVASPDEQVTITVSVQRVDNPGTRQEHWWVERTTQTHTVHKLMLKWLHQIGSFFNPLRTREIKAPCVQCGEEWVTKQVDGETKPHRVFVFVQDDLGNTLEARCLSCGLSWRRDQFEFLAAALNAGQEAA